MYRRKIPGQLRLEIAFDTELNPESKWVRIAKLIPWERIDEEYGKIFKSNEGQIAKSSRLAFAALYIQASEGYTDEKTRENIMENPHMQYFCGYGGYNPTPPFDASMMVHFRKRISAETVMKITEEVFVAEAVKEIDAPAEKMSEPADETDDAEGSDEAGYSRETVDGAAEHAADAPDDSNGIADGPNGGKASKKGTLILDATCNPQDIRYPTDVGLLNHARELSETIIDRLYKTIMDQYRYKPRTYRNVARRDYLSYAKTRKHTAKTIRKQLRKQLQYVARDLRIIEGLISEGAALDALTPQLYKKLLVIGEVYRQQREMYDTRTNRCESRIVSIAQPHVRPIVRGKEANPTEFGAKTAIGLVGGYAFITDISWENTAEASLLPQAAERYKDLFGFYPATIIGDGVYSNRDNRSWCKERSIRLSGPRLGRKNELIKQDEAKQLYEDSCERNAVEGNFGTTKRKYGLDLIMPKLPDTSKTSISMGFFAANMERKLRLLFSPESHPFIFYDFDLLTLIIPVNSHGYPY